MTYARPIKVELNNGWIFRIQYEENIDSVADLRDWAVGTILTTNNNYWTGDEIIGRDIDEYEVDDFLKKIVDEGGVVLPITMYVHSGMTVWHSNMENRYADSWDSGTVGFSYMTAETIQREYGALNDETREKAKNLLDSELKEIDLTMQGEVYWAGIFDEEGGLEDSTGGYLADSTLESMAQDMAETLDIDRELSTEIVDKIKNGQFTDI